MPALANVLANDQVPDPLTVMVVLGLRRMPPRYSRIVDPATPVPVMVGVREFVVWASTVGTAGAVVSTVSEKDADDGEMLPAVSDCVALSECSPSLRALAGMNAHAPEPLTVVEPRSVAPSYSASVEPATPVPAIDGVVEFVAAGELITGAAGAVVSTVTVMVVLVAFPAASVTVTVIV